MPAATTTHLLYLHGFRSSPQSAKARLTAAYVAERHPAVRLWCPQLPPSPRAAMALVHTGIAAWPQAHMAVVGSSLGGYYATWVAQQARCPSVLLNPAVDPARDLAAMVGEQSGYHDSNQRFRFEASHVDELRALTPPSITRPERYGAVIAKGDEVLDWHEMHDRYAGSTMRLVDGSDHGLSDFDDHLPFVLRFLGLMS